MFADRSYRVQQVVVEGDPVAVYLTWSATRRADAAPVEGRRAYHFRLAGGLIAEDWDVFSSMS